MREALRQILLSRWSKSAVFLLCLSPLGYLGWRAYHDELTANPVEFIQHFTGDWTLRLLLVTLAVTPLRRLLNLPDLIRFRRMLGLFAFTYVCLHFLTYIGPDQAFDLGGMWKDIAKRPFITVGFSAFVLMLPLALTSTAGSIRRLGGRNWQRLHRLIYATAILGVIHYLWLVKADKHKPLEYGAVLSVLLLYRAVAWAAERRKQGGISTMRPATEATQP